jgi:uncharacterized protein YdaU (DUF1376 family)
VNYFELYPGDYLRDTSRLTLVEHGAYLKLLLTYYAEESPLPAAHAELYAIAVALTPTDKAAVRKVADRYFPVGDDGLRHKNRCDEEIAKAQKRIEAARANGSKGGRKPQPKPNPAGNPAGSSDETQWVAQQGTQHGEALHTPHAIPPTGEITAGPPAAAVAEDHDGFFEGHDDPQRLATLPLETRMAVALTNAGFTCTYLNPNLNAYCQAGGTIEHVLQIAAHPDCAGKDVNYAINFARREIASKAKAITATPSRNAGPSRQLAGVAAILGVSPNDRPTDSRAELVLGGNQDGPGEPVRALPGRHTGG